MKKRKVLISIVVIVIASLLLFSYLSNRESKEKIAIITYIDHPVLNEIQNSFTKRLNTLIDNSLEYDLINFNAQGRNENLPIIAKQVISINPDLIVTISTPVSQYLMREIKSKQKIVYSFVTNPKDLGDEITRTNSTGISDAINYRGNIELIEELCGESAKVGMLYNPNESNSVFGVKRVKSIIKTKKLDLITKTVTKESEIPLAASELANNVDVIYIGGDNTVVGAAKSLTTEAYSKKIPVFASDEGSIKTGGAVAGISVNYKELGYETAKVVNKILLGKSPREIPRKKIVGDKLILNIKEANSIGFNLDDRVIERADKIIQ